VLKNKTKTAQPEISDWAVSFKSPLELVRQLTEDLGVLFYFFKCDTSIISITYERMLQI